MRAVTWAGAMLPAALAVPAAPAWGALQLSLRRTPLCVRFKHWRRPRRQRLCLALLPFPPSHTSACLGTRPLAHACQLAGFCLAFLKTKRPSPGWRWAEFVQMLEDAGQFWVLFPGLASTCPLAGPVEELPGAATLRSRLRAQATCVMPPSVFEPFPTTAP